ncbi:MAG TPA: DUF167 domain-containing protein [bacterium]|nr:DUF167 domain-containing protein [bacterium]
MKGSGSANADGAPAAPFHFADGVLTLQLHVQPGAARSGWDGPYGSAALKLRLAAPPVEGKANRACVAFLAQAAGVPRSAVHIVRGERSRDKRVRIAPITDEQFRELQRQWQA